MLPDDIHTGDSWAWKAYKVRIDAYRQWHLWRGCRPPMLGAAADKFNDTGPAMFVPLISLRLGLWFPGRRNLPPADGEDHGWVFEE